MNKTVSDIDVTCKAGFKTFEEVNKKFGQDIYQCNGCPNFIYRDGMASCKLLTGGNM